MRHFRLLTLMVAAWALSGAAPEARDLTFEERVRAQEKIDRVYYSHQSGATRPFEEAVPRAVLERKVRIYLKQTVALETFWRTPVTSAMLRRELERMAAGTRMPERLRELYTALGDDPLLIQECLARPALVDRLVRNFFARDSAMHDEARRTATTLRADLASGRLDPWSEHPGRTEAEVVRIDGRQERVRTGEVPGGKDGASRLELEPNEFERFRAGLPERAGETGPVVEDREAFVTRVVLKRTAGRLRVASYVVRKIEWEEWWSTVEGRLDEEAVTAARAADGPPPTPRSGARGFDPSAPCPPPNDSWDNGSLDDVPDPRFGHTAVWTGSLMVVWGGGTNTGGRYDPVTDTWTLTTTTNAPAPRRDHTAVWTGSQMVVWGGAGGAFYLNTGGRYDPGTDTWTPTSPTDAPSPRSDQTAVWTGSVMVVWGGYDGTYFNTGGRYDPGTDTWTPTSTTDAPASRGLHTAVWTGSLMVVWGGSDGNRLNTGGRYDPGNDTWTPTSTTNAPTGRYGHTAVWTGSLMVVWGDVPGTSLNTGGRYNPGTDTWTPTSTINAPTPRWDHTAVWTGSLMVVWGGSNGTYLNTGDRYNPATDTWALSSTTNAPAGRFRHEAIWTGSLMVVWGGFDGTYLNTGGRYDPATNTWTPTSTTSAPTGRYGHTAVWTGSLMVVWGGGLGGTSLNLNTGGRYDPATDIWTPTSGTGAPTPRSYHTAVWTGSLMVVWGGFGGTYLNTGGRYDPGTDTWTPTSITNAPSPRSDFTAVWTGSLMVVWGGNDGSFSSTGGRYDPGTNIWTPTSGTDAPSPRIHHTAVWTGSLMVVWGGIEADFSSSSTGGRYDPGTDTWTPTSPTNAPSPRRDHTAVWTGSLMVGWGGFDFSQLNTGGRYDPGTNTWMPTSPTGPSPRSYHTAVWTGSLMVVWGGYGGTYLNTGGRYDPATDTWTPTSPTNAPASREYHTSVWTGSLMVVWGGYGGTYLSSGGRYVVRTVQDGDGDGFDCSGDCDDSRAAVFPGAPQVCDGLNNDCGFPGWPALQGTNEFDHDGDGFTICGADCNDGNPSTYSGAPEVNDGLDNQCSSNPGFGVADEISGVAGFTTPGNNTEFCWAAQPGAAQYQVARSTSPDFSTACTTWITDTSCQTDPTLPPVGGAFFYRVRPLAPHLGSWGQDSTGAEVFLVCGSETVCNDGFDDDGDGPIDCEDPDCFSLAVCQPSTFTFDDTLGDDIADTALLDFFNSITAGPGDYLFFEIQEATGPSALCTARADFYRDNYIAFATSGTFVLSQPWEKWFRLQATGGIWAFDAGSYPNLVGPACFTVYSWCPEWTGFQGAFALVVHPAHPSPDCETVDGYVGCGGSDTWRFTLKVGPSRLSTCGF